MSHKIQTSATSQIILEINQQTKGTYLQLYKMLSTGRAEDSLLTCTHSETKQLHAIVMNIDPEKYLSKEYGKMQIGNKTYKILISEFRGIKSFQIREWTVSQSYTGFAKQGISLPTYKIKEFQTHLTSVLEKRS